jgi:hypothetical protein
MMKLCSNVGGKQVITCKLRDQRRSTKGRSARLAKLAKRHYDPA